MISELLNKLRQLKVNIDVVENTLDIQAPKGVLNKELVDEIKLHKPEIIRFIKTYKNKSAQHHAIPLIEPAPDYKLSSAQRRLWVLSQFGDGSIAYNMPGVYVFEGDLQEDHLEHAFSSLIARHEILRTVFREDEKGEIRQIILNEEKVNFKTSKKDLRAVAEKENVLKKLVQAELVTAFDLTTGPLFRAGLFQLEDNKWVLSYVIHHIISDGWSMGILINDLLAFYNAYSKGSAANLPSLRIQYKEYAAWQLDQLASDQLKEHKAYWLNRFSGELPVLNLSTDKVRPAVKTYNGGIVKKELSKELTTGLRTLSKEYGGTLFMTLLSAVNTLLYRYSGQEDIIIGTPVAGRDHVELENQIGFYINTLALRTQFNGEESFKKLYETVRKATLDAYEHQMYPVDELIDDLNLKRDMSRNPIFDVMVALQNRNMSNSKETKQLGTLKVSGYVNNEEEGSKFDLMFDFIELEEGLQLDLEYNSDLYERATAERMFVHMEELLKELIKDPGKQLKDLEFIGAAEKHQLLHVFNSDKIIFPASEKNPGTQLSMPGYIGEFRNNVNKTPDKIAVTCADKKFTYWELDILSNKLCHYLLSKTSISPEDLIGVKIERNEWLLVSVLAVFKLRAAYVPIDPSYPAERVAYLVENSNCRYVIDDALMADFILRKESIPGDDFICNAGLNDLAYVIYTSGSTGKPKGTMIEHIGMLNHMHAMIAEFQLDADSVIVQNAAYTFDISVWQLLTALVSGGTTAIYDNSTVLDPSRFIENVAMDKITVLQVVPSYLKVMLDLIKSGQQASFSSLRYLSVTGEAVSKQIIDEWFKLFPGIKVVNAYGPAEASDDVTLHIMTQAPSERNIPVGKPIMNMKIHILDKYDRLCPIGVEGEICVSGVGVGRGYLKDEEKTKKSFTVDPFYPGTPARMYKTGDIGKWRADGNVLFSGRTDSQVKVRGFRIELGEIELGLVELVHIDKAIVVAKDRIGSDPELIAYIVSNEQINVSSLRSELGKKIPYYMVPAYFVQVNEIPLTPNGKIDKKALPDPADLGLTAGVEYVMPSNDLEKKLVAIWTEVLGIDEKKIGIKDNFFELGGHSLKAIRVISKIHEQFNMKLDVSIIFQDPFVESIAKYIEAASYIEQEVETTDEGLFF